MMPSFAQMRRLRKSRPVATGPGCICNIRKSPLWMWKRRGSKDDKGTLADLVIRHPEAKIIVKRPFEKRFGI